MRMKLSDDMEADDPILSVVNLIDVFLVIIAALLLAMANSPANPMGAEKVTIIKSAGTPEMEIIIKDGQKIERFKKSEGEGQGRGVKAGSAYRMQDGSMVYVPE